MKLKCTNCILSLGEKSRIEIYKLLTLKDKLTVSEIVRELQVNQPTVSHHLQVLNKMGLVTFEKNGKYKNYSLAPKCPHYAEKCILQN